MGCGIAVRMGSAGVLAALCLTAGACGGETSAQRTVTVTGPAATTAPLSVTAPAATTPTTTAPAATAPAEPALVDRPPGFPTTGERFLLARVDPEVARRCTREGDGDRSRGSIAGIVCETQALYGVRYYVELFRNRVAMEASYGRYRDANDVPVARGQCVPPGGGGRVPGDATWGFGAEAPSEGRVMCFRSDGETWFITSVEKINVLAFARSTRFGALDRFWRSVGIPGAEPVG